VAQREAFLATDGPLTALAHQQIRCVFRPTQVYASVLQKSLQPQCLRDGADRSIEIDVLSRALLWSESKHPFWPLLKAELQALEQMDIPYFTADSDSDALWVSSNETIEQCFAQPSYNQVIARLQRLSDEDLAQQIAIIRSSLYSMVAGEPNHAPLAKNVELNLDAVAPLSQDVMVQQAVAIAQDLQQRAIRAADGSATWIGLEFLPHAKRFQLQPIGYNLYDGSCGIALFLAAVTKVTDDNQFRDLSLGALQPLRKILQHLDSESEQKITKLIGIGGAVGLGSIVYALVQISQFLDEATLLEDAKRAASLISPAAIAADQLFDIMAGAAGAILGLLALHEVTADPAVLEQAAICGHHLLNHRITSDTGFRTWAIPDEEPLTGFSHGAAGIAYALLRLSETTQDAAFQEAAQEAIAYERSVFSPTVGNWPDLRSLINSDNQPSFMTSWCHGATGIGLARLGSLAILDNPDIRQEIAIALNTTLKFGLQDIDHPCCGNCGRIDLLLVAAQKLSRPELREIAQKQAAWVVAKAKQAGAFHLFPNLPKDVYNPGFFQGTAGIGYELLRLAYPNILPSVLLWDSNQKREHPVFAKVPGDFQEAVGELAEGQAPHSKAWEERLS
jgi:type 2 lantibiotic biosynthesis protein LanM